MVHEFQRMSRVIPLDGRKHREGLEPMFYGDPSAMAAIGKATR